MGKASRAFSAYAKSSTELGFELLKVFADPDFGMVSVLGDEANVKSLLWQGASLDVRDKNGMNALMWAITHGNYDFAIAFAKTCDLQAQDLQHSTALHYALRHGETEVALALIDKGIKLDQKAGVTKETPLMIAAYNGDVRAVAALLAKDANIEKKDHRSRTAADIAKEGYRKESGSVEYINIMQQLEEKQTQLDTFRRAEAAKPRVNPKLDVSLKENITVLKRIQLKPRPR